MCNLRSQRLRPFVQDVEVARVSEHPLAFAAGDLADNVEVLESFDGAGYGRVGGPGLFGQSWQSGERTVAERGEYPQGVCCGAPERLHAGGVLVKKREQEVGGFDGGSCGDRDAFEEEVEPSFPVTFGSSVSSRR